MTMAQFGLVYHVTLIACYFLAYEKQVRRERYPFKTYLPDIAKRNARTNFFYILVYLNQPTCLIQQPQL